jgi:hypothetical protein
MLLIYECDDRHSSGISTQKQDSDKGEMDNGQRCLFGLDR